MGIDVESGAIRLTAAPAVDGYALELVPGENRRELIVVVSAGKTFAMRKRYTRDALYVADLGTGYFITSPRRIAAAIVAFVDAGRYERLLLAGSSKAGFAVLMLGGLCARARPRLPVRVLAFNPVTRLFPDDKAIPYPSYRKLHRRSAANDALARRLRRFGDLSHLAWLPNFHAVITYPARNPVDTIQALRMKGRNFRRYPVDSALHGTMFFFTWQGASEAVVLKRLGRLFSSDPDDSDLAAMRPADLAAVAKAVAEADLPTFEEVVEEAMTVDPPRMIGERALRAVALRVVLACRAIRGASSALKRRYRRTGVTKSHSSAPVRPSPNDDRQATGSS